MNPDNSKDSSRPKVALVLGSGGIKSCASIGLWKVLQHEQIEVDMLVGCGGGGLCAAAFAQGLDTEAVTAFSKSCFDRKLIAKRSFRGLLKGLLPQLFGFDESIGLVSDRRHARGRQGHHRNGIRRPQASAGPLPGRSGASEEQVPYLRRVLGTHEGVKA